MWTAKNRARYDRKGLRYPSDMTDEEWGYVEPLIPPAKRGGRKPYPQRLGFLASRLHPPYAQTA